MTDRSTEPIADVICIEALSHPFAVRDMLAKLTQGLSSWGLDANTLHKVELVVAEALNNVYEHACGYQDGIYFSTTARFVPPGLVIEVVDHGAAMPGFVLPKQALATARPPRVDVPVQALPEGGWGWMLIRDLTEDTCYERKADGNHLRLRMRLT